MSRLPPSRPITIECRSRMNVRSERSPGGGGLCGSSNRDVLTLARRTSDGADGAVGDVADMTDGAAGAGAGVEAHLPSAPRRRPGETDGSPRSRVQRHLVFLCDLGPEPHGAALGVLDVDDRLEEAARPLVA